MHKHLVRLSGEVDNVGDHYGSMLLSQYTPFSGRAIKELIYIIYSYW